MITFSKFFCASVLCALIAFVSTVGAAETPQRDARSVVNALRLKSLTKNLELTADQQKQVQGLFDEEAKVVAKLGEDLTPVQRATKIKEIQQATYVKMKPILTEAQAEKWDKMQADANKPKKKKPAA